MLTTTLEDGLRVYVARHAGTGILNLERKLTTSQAQEQHTARPRQALALRVWELSDLI